MFELATEGLILRIMYAVLMVCIVWLLLRGLDKISGVNFKNTMGVISEDPIAASHYLGLRFIGVVIGIGLLLS